MFEVLKELCGLWAQTVTIPNWAWSCRPTFAKPTIIHNLITNAYEKKAINEGQSNLSRRELMPLICHRSRSPPTPPSSLFIVESRFRGLHQWVWIPSWPISSHLGIDVIASWIHGCASGLDCVHYDLRFRFGSVLASRIRTIQQQQLIEDQSEDSPVSTQRRKHVSNQSSPCSASIQIFSSSCSSSLLLSMCCRELREKIRELRVKRKSWNSGNETSLLTEWRALDFSVSI